MTKVINLLKKEPIQLIHLVNTESETLRGKCYGPQYVNSIHWDTMELVARDVDGFDVITVTRDDKKFLALGYWNEGVAELPF